MATKVSIATLFMILLEVGATSGYNESCRVRLDHPDNSLLRDTKILDKNKVVPLMIIGFGGFSVLLACGYNAVRKKIFKDAHNLDTTFDAGGRVTFSLTVVTVTSQMLWPSDFLQSTIVASKYGLAGSLWIAMGTVFCTLVFPMMSVHIKTKAPGAKTYLQVIYARFGKPTHILFCCMAIIANLVAISALIMSGKAAFDVLVKDVSDELVVMVLAILFGSYCFIGGLGTTFYISYFNTTITFIAALYFIWTIYYSNNSNVEAFASTEAFYDALSCLKTPEGHYKASYLNFRSFPAFLNGLIMFFIATAMSYCDQACWQSRIAAKPSQGVVGFFIAALVWFGIPTTISMTSALTYMSMSFQNGSHIMTSGEIDSGYITPYVMQVTMGSTGGYLLITILTMALMSTGSGEVMALSSIIVYDIYKIYVNPFRKCKTSTMCLLCGKEKFAQYETGGDKSTARLCSCSTSDDCEDCKEDSKLQMCNKGFGTKYICMTHGSYRHYEDHLIRQKTWCIIWVTIAHVPFGLLLMSTDINLQWSFYVLQILLSPFLVPLLLSLTWSKCTSKGLIVGCVSGFVAAITGELVVAAHVYPDGLNEFIANTSGEYSVIAGVLSGVIVSTSVCIVISLKITKVRSESDKDNEWLKTISINNPLNPWQRIYKTELARYENKRTITHREMGDIFKISRRVAYVGGGIALFSMVIILPATLLTFDELSFENVSGWIIFNHLWCLVSAIFAIFVPPVQECLQIFHQYNENKKKTSSTEKQKLNRYDEITKI